MIKITNNGYIHFKDKCIGEGAVLSMLGEKLELEEGFTLNSFFKMLNLYPILTQLEPYLPLYLDYYNQSGYSEKEINTEFGKKLLFNTYLLEKEGQSYDKKHSLTVKHLSGFLCNTSIYQLFDILPNEIMLNENIVTFKLEPSECGKSKNFVKQTTLYKAKHPCDLFNFIMYMSGNLFNGKSPERRRNSVEVNQIPVKNLANGVISEINRIIESH